ncbi:MAG TPA: ABC-type transport auxiliary lipoprotein family protein [Noviherbaspirillum sp.]|nr:ABC-type transport auxiliary lipoprotein family protein [Noviherbaspirillum sp.]
MRIPQCSTRLIAMLLALPLALSGCAAIRSEAPMMFDLGPVRLAPDTRLLAGTEPVNVAEVATPAWLDSQYIYFRLNYAEPQQPRPYVASRWVMPPAQMLAQQIRQRIAQAGGIALRPGDGAFDAPTLRVQVDDFSQQFAGPERSAGRVALRATLLRGRTVLGQRTFIHEVPAQRADAAGGAHALAVASDAALGELVAWLATLELRR